jgi:adenylate cyclase
VAEDPAYILVVDDDPINRALLAKSLAREGHEHAIAEDGREGLEKLRAEPFDIVLLDVLMPELDGYEVLRRIEDDPELRHVPVIMISALEDLDSVVRCIELGAEDYLPKPFDPVLLRARINGCLTKKRLHDLERQRVRDVFSRFVPEPVVDEVLRRTDDDLRLRGVRVTGTVLFGDLRGFTSFAETIPADEVIEVLNDYLSRMSDAILDSGGTLVAYQGDGIMAVFGAPIETDDHADRALAAARDMLGKRLPRFNRSLRENGLGDGFRMGIGLNSGPLMSGTVGSLRRLEYSAIGDTTNTASRLQAMTKGTPHSLLIAESTRELLRRPAGDLVFVDERDVPGRRARIRLWTLESTSGAAEELGLATAGAAAAPERTSSG